MRILRSITIKKTSSRRSLMSPCYKTIISYCSCAYVEILSTWEVWRALKRLELHSGASRATLTPLSCSPNFPSAQYLDIRMLTHELIVNYNLLTRNIPSYTKVNGLKIAEELLHSIFWFSFFSTFNLGIALSLECFCCTLCNSGSVINIPEIFLGDTD